MKRLRRAFSSKIGRRFGRPIRIWAYVVLLATALAIGIVMGGMIYCIGMAFGPYRISNQMPWSETMTKYLGIAAGAGFAFAYIYNQLRPEAK